MLLPDSQGSAPVITTRNTRLGSSSSFRVSTEFYEPDIELVLRIMHINWNSEPRVLDVVRPAHAADYAR